MSSNCEYVSSNEKTAVNIVELFILFSAPDTNIDTVTKLIVRV